MYYNIPGEPEIMQVAIICDCRNGIYCMNLFFCIFQTRYHLFANDSLRTYLNCSFMLAIKQIEKHNFYKKIKKKNYLYEKLHIVDDDDDEYYFTKFIHF